MSSLADATGTRGGDFFPRSSGSLGCRGTIGLDLGPSSTPWGPPMPEIRALVESSQHLLDLEEDWDGEGALPLSKDALGLAETCLRTCAQVIWQEAQTRLTLPQLGLGGADGSVDLLWAGDHWQLLANIAPDGTGTYYAEDSEGNSGQGTFNPTLPAPLVGWLRNLSA